MLNFWLEQQIKLVLTYPFYHFDIRPNILAKWMGISCWFIAWQLNEFWPMLNFRLEQQIKLVLTYLFYHLILGLKYLQTGCEFHVGSLHGNFMSFGHI